MSSRRDKPFFVRLVRDETCTEAGVITLELPYPPTGNTAVRHARNGRHYLTERAKAYRKEVWGEVYNSKAKHTLFSRLRISVHMSPPDKRKRDLDNAWKTLSDAMQWAGVFADDSQIDDLRLLRTALKPGTVVVFIEQIREPDGPATD